MAVSSDLKKVLCLQWTTPLPAPFYRYHSQPFFLFGSEWVLGIEEEEERDTYMCSVLLQNCSPEKELKGDFEVKTFVQDLECDTELLLGASATVRAPSCVIWKDRTALIPRKKVVIFQFHFSGNPSKIRSRNETLILSDEKLNSLPDLESLSLDLSNLLEDEERRDTTLSCGDGTFNAHKIILAARSPVFSAMFRNRMAEAETGTVRIEDMDAPTFGLFLRYLYSGRVPDLSEETAVGLYVAGDKYAVPALRRSCSVWMVEHLTPVNCLESLVLADAHSDAFFKNAVVDYVSEHLQALDRDSWTAFKEEYPRLSVAVYDRHCAETLSLQG